MVMLLKKSDQYVFVKGQKTLRRSTKGWHLCIKWKDGSTSWERLADVKEPAFEWWVSHFLKKRDRIITAVAKQYHKITHKFGIRVPKSVTEAEQVDNDNGNTLWQDAIKKEMDAVCVALKVLNGDEKPPPTYQHILCHMIFDVKMKDFRRKARYVAGGHTTEAPATLTYASVVSRETVRIALTLAALNDLDIKVSDIQNAYLRDPVKELIWMTLGPKWGPDEEKKVLTFQSLYRLKSAGALFRNTWQIA